MTIFWKECQCYKTWCLPRVRRGMSGRRTGKWAWGGPSCSRSAAPSRREGTSSKKTGCGTILPGSWCASRQLPSSWAASSWQTSGEQLGSWESWAGAEAPVCWGWAWVLEPLLLVRCHLINCHRIILLSLVLALVELVHCPPSGRRSHITQLGDVNALAVSPQLIGSSRGAGLCSAAHTHTLRTGQPGLRCAHCTKMSSALVSSYQAGPRSTPPCLGCVKWQ